MQAKINTGMYRESEDDPDEEPDDAYDPFIRFDGRQQEVQPEMLGGSRPGYQYEPPTEGADLIGYKIRATFPTGRSVSCAGTTATSSTTATTPSTTITSSSTRSTRTPNGFVGTSSHTVAFAFARERLRVGRVCLRRW